MSQVAALEINDLHAWYGESHILHGLNLQVRPGEVVTLLGRNGAGRTTTLRAIMGLVGQRRGAVRILGQETIHLPTHRIAHQMSTLDSQEIHQSLECSGIEFGT